MSAHKNLGSMSSNAFLTWPLWHSFTLNFQNAGRNTDQVRLMRPPNDGVVVRGSEYEDVVQYMAFYDFMADRIIMGMDITDALLVPIPSLMTNPSYTTSDRYVMTKDLGREVDGSVVGGNFAPYVGKASDVIKLLRGLSATIRGNPAPTLTELRNSVNMTALMSKPEYGSALIKAINKSYEQPARPMRDERRFIQRITTLIDRNIPNDMAINLISGMSVGASSPKYTYYEYSVQAPSSTSRKVIKFAVPTGTPSDEREHYLSILKDVFKAEEATSTQISEDDRRAIEIRPVRMTHANYQRLFPGTDSVFSSYFNPVATTTTHQIADAGQTMHHEAFTVGPEDDYLDDEDDIDNY